MSEEAGQADVHALPDIRTRERVSLQSLLDTAAAHRDRARPLSDGAPNKNLVPKPADEAQKRAAGRQGDQRAGEEGTGGTGATQAAAAGKTAGETGAAEPLVYTPASPRPHEDGPRQIGQCRPTQSSVQGSYINARQ